MVSVLIALAGLGVGILVAWVGPRLLERLSLSRRLTVAIISTVVGLILFALSYLFLFDRATCSISDVACVANANEGMLALTAIVIAAVSIWLGVLSDERQDRREKESAGRRRETLLRSVVQEAAHNLLHISLVTRHSKLTYVPQLTTSELERFISEQHGGAIGDAFERDARSILRNIESVRLASVSADESSDNGLDPMVSQSLQSFTSNNLRILFHLYCDSDISISVSDTADAAFSRLATKAHQAAGAYVAFSTSESEVEDQVSELRTLGRPLVCWVNDNHREGVETFEFSPIFYDAGHKHVL